MTKDFTSFLWSFEQFYVSYAVRLRQSDKIVLKDLWKFSLWQQVGNKINVLQSSSLQKHIKTLKLTVCRDSNNQIAMNLWLVINIKVMDKRDGLRYFTLFDQFFFASTTWKNFFLTIIVTVTVH